MDKLLLCTLVVGCVISFVSCGTNPSGISNSARSGVALFKLAKSVVPSTRSNIFSYNLARADSLELSEPCKSHYDFYQQSMLGFQQWALKMYDSSTKFPPYSLLEGAFVHLGNFDECVDVRDIEWNNASVFHGKHCLASYSFTTKSSKPTRASLPVFLVGMTLKMAQCVPSSCSLKDAAEIAKNAMSSISNELTSAGVELVVDVAEQDCHTADPVEFGSGDMIATAILCGFGGLVLFSTCYDISTKEADSRSNLATAFSVYSNGKKLLATSSGGDVLHCLHGIRFLSMAWVILGHRYMVGFSLPAINSRTFLNDFLPDWKRTPLTNATLSVDTFFLLSGLLVAYVFFKSVPKTNSFNVPMYYIHRYIRLTPPLAIIILLRVTLLNHAGSGPLWESYTISESTNCEDNWWVNLLYVQNYVNKRNMCISQSWYLAVDMQLYWFAPLLLVPLWKWPKIGLALSGILMVVGCVISYVIAYENEFPTNFLQIISSGASAEIQEKSYYPVYTRFVPYVIGILLGYALVYLKDTGRKLQFSKLISFVLWVITLAMLAGTLFCGVSMQQEGYEYEVVGASFFYALMRPGWALGLAMLIFLAATGHGGFINTLLSWNFFQPLSRLTYTSYLVHIAVQQSQYASLRTLTFLGDMTFLPQFFADVVITLIFAAGLSLVFESPFIILEKELLGGRKPTSKPKDVPGLPNVGQPGTEANEVAEADRSKLKEP